MNMHHNVRMGGSQDRFLLRIVGNLCYDGWVPRLVYWELLEICVRMGGSQDWQGWAILMEYVESYFFSRLNFWLIKPNFKQKMRAERCTVLC